MLAFWHYFVCRYCILKLSSANACEEVRSALHGKHIEPYQGILKCIDTTTKILSETSHLQAKLLKDARLTRPETKLLKFKRYILLKNFHKIFDLKDCK